MEHKVFVVEDDESIRGLYEIAFQDKFNCTSFECAEDMFKVLEKELCDIIILDLMLPGMDGLEALAKLKQNSHTREIPVIIASAKGDESIKVRGLDAGADDYLAKPFGMLELIARVKANLRKKSNKSTDDVIECGDVRINNAEHTVYVKGEPVTLTLKEYNLLLLLVKKADCVVKRETILSDVWDYEFVGETRTLDMHIKSLRSKLAEHSDKQYISTIRGVGYRFLSK
ncbi:MAG: response regulator transcription factor [Clostridia bacterium]|nr:response regulator transcription factor [Clostridia bacterium]MDE7329072.1 response regulator transcription factor [Clostridia bacterium]